VFSTAVMLTDEAHSGTRTPAAISRAHLITRAALSRCNTQIRHQPKDIENISLKSTLKVCKNEK